MLPGCCKQLKKVSDFQTHLQDFLKNRATEGCPEWRTLSSKRGALLKHLQQRKRSHPALNERDAASPTGIKKNKNIITITIIIIITNIITTSIIIIPIITN
jgi:hypothetical protein